MPKLIILYDPDDKISGMKPEDRKRFGVKEATLSLADDVDGLDLRAVAIELAGLLISQLDI